MKINFKNFGFLEFLVSASAIFVVGMLIWTASTRPAVEAKANLVKENHNKVVDLINDELTNVVITMKVNSLFGVIHVMVNG